MSRVIGHPIVKNTAFSPIVHTRGLINCLSELGVVSLEPLGLTDPTWLSGEFRDLVEVGKPLVTISSSPYKPNVGKKTKADLEERSPK